MLMTVSIGIIMMLLEMVCKYFRKEITCELLVICTLVHVNHNFQIKDHSISVDHARCATYIVTEYLYNATVKADTKFYKTTLIYDIIFTKADASTSDEKVEKLTI